MELFYTLINVYSPDTARSDKAKQIMNDFIDTEYVEEREVIETATDNDSVILIEVEQDDGLAETILVNNKGELRKRDVFSNEKVDEARKQLETVPIEEFFSKKAQKFIEEHCKENGITKEECVEEYLFDILLDVYEDNKTKLSNSLKKYYKK